MSMLALNCGKTFNAEAQTFNAMAVTVILPPASSALGANVARNCSSSVMSALSCCVTCGIVVHASHRCSRGLAAHAAHGDAFDLSPLGEIGQLGLREMRVAGPTGRGRGESAALGVRLYIVFADASARADPLRHECRRRLRAPDGGRAAQRERAARCSVPATLPSCAGMRECWRRAAGG